MGARELLATLAERGFSVKADRGNLVVRPSSLLTDELRATLRAEKPALLTLLTLRADNTDGKVMQVRPSPLLTAEQADRAHWPAWDGDEIDCAVSRIHLFVRRGIPADDAEHLAERLLLRDREHDDRHMCLECRHGNSTRCPDGALLPAGLLHRCSIFVQARVDQ